MKVHLRNAFLVIGLAAAPLYDSGCGPASGTTPGRVAAEGGASGPTRPGDGGSKKTIGKPASPVTSTSSESLPPGVYRIGFKFGSNDPLYYTIENEFRDSGGVPPLLSFTTSVKDRRFITQRVMPSTLPARGPNAGGEARIEWECDRYDARESGMKDESIYDSLRHTFPPPALRNLATIPGSKCTFTLDAEGRAKNLDIKAGVVAGSTGRGAPTKTTERCALSAENITHLLEDLGPYYLPQRPVRVGEEWTRSYVDPQKTFGAVTTLLRCRLRSVRRSGDSEIAVIEVQGDVTLQPVSSASPPQPTSRPGQPNIPAPPPPAGQRDFQIERAVCTGTIEFDMTRGELVRLDLLRELAVSADIDMKQTSQSFSLGAMKLKSGAFQRLRVTGSHSPAPKPIIVGGPKPPPMPPDEAPRSVRPAAAAAPTSQRVMPLPKSNEVPPRGASPPPLGKRPAVPRTAQPATSRPATPLPFLPPAPGAKIQPPPLQKKAPAGSSEHQQH